MALFLLLIFLSLSSVSPVSRSVEHTLAETKQNFSASYKRNLLNSDCGGVIQEPNFGQMVQISYKPTDMISANEHCSWRVTMTNVSSYQLILSTSGFTPASKTLTVTTFMHRNDAHRTFIPAVGSEMEINGQLLLVTLHAKPESPETAGFTLFILPIKDNSSIVSNNSIHVSLGNNAIIAHPNTGNYSSNEMSTFLMPPRSIPTIQRIFFTQKKLEALVPSDYLAFYKFNTSDPSWKEYIFIHPVTHQLVLNATDGMFVIFHSDSANEYEGFTLGSYYDRC